MARHQPASRVSQPAVARYSTVVADAVRVPCLTAGFEASS